VPSLHSIVELEALAACWLAMGEAATIDEIEAAALRGLLGLTDAKIAYTARRHDTIWTMGAHIGLSGDVAGISVPEELVPYAEALRAGLTICYEDPAAMGAELAQMLGGIGLGSLYAVPIMKAGECVGALAVGALGPSLFGPRDRALVRLFTAHLSALSAKRDLVQSLETLAESVPVIVLRTEPSGWINWYNRRWYEFTGQTREEAAGWGWQTAHHPEDFQRVMKEWPLALATGRPIDIEFRLKRYDGVYHWHLARVEPVRDDNGKIISWYGSVIDIEAQKAALERTQRVVETLQEAFIPQHLPQREALRLDATYVSAESDAHVGGDWYDAFPMPDGRLGFSIGDVAGHGLAASLAVGKLRQAIYTVAQGGHDPAAILAETNRILRMQESGTFVTALVGFINAAGNEMTYATAGHPSPMIAYRADVPATSLPSGGPPLGVLEDLVLETHHVPIATDTVVLLYTDGITEFARDALAGEATLRAILPTFVGNTSIARPASLVYELALGGQAPPDDVAVLLMQFSRIDRAQAAHRNEPVPTKEWRFHASDAQAAHVARREVAAYLHHLCGETDGSYASELIAGELLANTVEHAPGLVFLSIEWTGTQLILVVRDSGPGIGYVRKTLPADLMQEGSRGLFLVHELSLDVSVVESAAGGAELRVVLPLAPSGEPIAI
jgi:PAS domain S-box-containing protein